ncbi:hypothetical protein FHP25_38370 [Vineibacter terrae]|uniref:Lipoprotein n=1 Tax=Vineibacter terrae TaxID=2586908 RepID=A0A5C8P8P0_9HYPH|nr:hypothetical protein [Vineibacter terrae]TXL69597.1 hypothetical protein FHP25_38370 [Vineibacter terrae]
MPAKGLLTAVAILAVLGACSYKEEKVVQPRPAPAPAVVTPAPSASDTCVRQGYPSGTPAYDACVARMSRP